MNCRKGLTKYNNKSLMKQSETLKKRYREDKNIKCGFKKGYKPTEEHRRKISEAKKGQNNLSSEKRSLIVGNLWKNNKYRENQIKSILKGLMKRPTSLEQDMINICKKYNLPFIYTGDGRFLIGYKNPDFIHKNKKICVEVANTFHHTEDYPEKRINYFKKYGWDCIVFRTDKLNEKVVVNTIRRTGENKNS